MAPGGEASTWMAMRPSASVVGSPMILKSMAPTLCDDESHDSCGQSSHRQGQVAFFLSCAPAAKGVGPDLANSRTRYSRTLDHEPRFDLLSHPRPHLCPVPLGNDPLSRT